MSDYFEHRDRVAAQRQAEAEGRVADDLEYRKALIARMKAGEITFEQMQAELKATKRSAKKNGKITRAQAYRGY